MKISASDRNYATGSKRNLRPFIGGKEITFAIAASSGWFGWVDRYVTATVDGRERVSVFTDCGAHIERVRGRVVFREVVR